MLGAKGTKRSRPLPTASKLPDHHFERLKKERKFIWGNPVDAESEDSESRHTRYVPDSGGGTSKDGSNLKRVSFSRSKGNAGPVDFKAYESCVVDGKEYVAGGFVLVSDDKKESVLQIEFMGEVDGKCTLRGQLLADVEDIKHNQIRTWLAKWDSTLTDQVGSFSGARLEKNQESDFSSLSNRTKDSAAMCQRRTKFPSRKLLGLAPS
jgi:hypothetical protein